MLQMVSGKVVYSHHTFLIDIYIYIYIYIYMDDLTIALNKCNTRCVICSTTINNLMYADDLVILSPSVSRLSELMQVCGLYGLNHDIKYNSKKSAVLIFKSN